MTFIIIGYIVIAIVLFPVAVRSSLRSWRKGYCYTSPDYSLISLVCMLSSALWPVYLFGMFIKYMTKQIDKEMKDE